MRAIKSSFSQSYELGIQKSNPRRLPSGSNWDALLPFKGGWSN